MKKIITLMLAAIAAVTVIAGGCSGSTKTAETESTRSETGGLIVSEEPRESSPMKLTVARASEENAIAAQSADSYTVTATVTPSHATITDVSWALSFANPSSSWASGKNVSDYVELTAGVSSATVRCKAAFGEQIILTATAQGNPSLKANCTLDYVKRVESASLNCSVTKYGLHGESCCGYEMTKNYSLGVGTITGTFNWASEIEIYMSDSSYMAVCDSRYYEELNRLPDSGLDMIHDNFVKTYSEADWEEGADLFEINCLYFATIADGYSRLSNQAQKLLQAAYYDGLNGKTNNGYFRISYTYVYNGVDYGSGTVSSNYFTYDVSDLYVSVTNLSLSNTHYVF